MKQCPACRTTYTDETLVYCLADGVPLEPVHEVPTAVSPRRAGSSAFPWLKIVLGLIGAAVIGIAVLGVAGALFYYSTGKRTAKTAGTPVPSPSERPNSDPERERLEKELAELQKKLDEQKTAPVNTQPFPGQNSSENGSPVTATVNSPGDGFLALRSEPSTAYGQLLVKIPHSAEVELSNCEKKRVTVDGRAGRWCLVIYKQHAGWVFDGWLKY